MLISFNKYLVDISIRIKNLIKPRKPNEYPFLIFQRTSSKISNILSISDEQVLFSSVQS